jgi:phosphate acetyltransferase
MRSVYVTSFEPQSGKSIVALGLVEMLSARAEVIGFFRPVATTADGPDPQVELIRERYGIDAFYDELFAATDSAARELIAANNVSELETRAMRAYQTLADRHELMVCEGTDFDATSALDHVDVNARLANALGAPVLAVVRGDRGVPVAEAVHAASVALTDRGCTLFGAIVTRVAQEAAAEAAGALLAERPPVYVLTEQAELTRPTIAEVAAVLDAAIVAEPAGGGMEREVATVRVAAMGVENFVADLEPSTLVIVPGDRTDILLATLAPGVPVPAAVLLTAGYEPDPAALGLLRDAPFPLLQTPARTYEVVGGVDSVRPQLRAGGERKVAAALGAFASAVDPLELERRFEVERPQQLTPSMFESELLERARENPQRIVLPEGDDERVLRAADLLLRRGAARLTILGDFELIETRASGLGIDLSAATLISPAESFLRDDFAERYMELRKRDSITEELAFEAAADPMYFGTLLMLAGEADGLVAGATRTTADAIRPALELIEPLSGEPAIAGAFLVYLPDRVLMYADGAITAQPSTEELAEIAIGTAANAFSLGIDPKVAMLSASTGSDAANAAADVVRERQPQLPVDGPMSYEAAIDAGQATVLVFPDLESANIAYRAQRALGASALGPVLHGLSRPVNNLSRDCRVEDVVNTVVITAIQAQEVGGRSTSRLARLPSQLGPAV